MVGLWLFLSNKLCRLSQHALSSHKRGSLVDVLHRLVMLLSLILVLILAVLVVNLSCAFGTAIQGLLLLLVSALVSS